VHQQENDGDDDGHARDRAHDYASDRGSDHVHVDDRVRGYAGDLT